MGGKPWSVAEKELFLKLWAEGASKEEIQTKFPTRTWKSLQNQAKYNGVKRGFKEEQFGESTLNAWYICGFTDGEGYFRASIRKTPSKSLNISFGIKLREDDGAILDQIRNYFKCGSIYHREDTYEQRVRYGRVNAKPQVIFEVFRQEDLINTIIPFFENYPLQAKKGRDFEIWKQIVQERNNLVQGNPNTEVWERIEQLVTLIHETREYRA